MRCLRGLLTTTLLVGLGAIGCGGGGGGSKPDPAVAPTITTQPTSRTVNEGQAASLTVVASGTAPLSYQWRKDGANLASGTAATFSLAAVVPGDAGSYSVVVSNSVGTVTSSAAVVTVNVAPVITTQPVSKTVYAGQPVSFSLTASGTAPLSYQWKKDGSALSGATGSFYSIGSAQSGDAGSYTVVVSNSAGSVTSNAAALTVNPVTVAPSITSQPTSQTVTAGRPASFSVTATGTAPLSYQWKKDGAAISGAIGSSYSIGSAQIGDAGNYTVVVSNSAGSATSNTATLSVNPVTVAPSITSQPTSQTVTASQPASFSVTASGTAPLAYQWKKGGTDISGATTSTYSITSTQSADAGNYTVVVSNSAGSSTSNVATLTVNPVVTAPTITSHPTSQTVTAGQAASFSVTASGTAPLTYQWKMGGTDISGATASTYSITSTQSADAGNYTVVVSNSAGSATSNVATLTVNSLGTPLAFTLPGGASLEVKPIPAGTFLMGRYTGEQDSNPEEDPQHSVTLSPFYVATYETTQGQWVAVMGTNPSSFQGDLNLPVEQVSYLDITDGATGYLKKLNDVTAGQRPAGMAFRLPTEAEWEYASRGGTGTRFYWGEDPSYTAIQNYAWYWDNAGGRTHPVGQKLPNAYGLYDMSGNVWEWCQDWYDLYPIAAQSNPLGPTDGVNRLLRGGTWGDYSYACRSAKRFQYPATSSHYSVGFRVVLAPLASTTLTFTLSGNIPLDVKSIPGGTFLMGRYQGEQDSGPNEDPQHAVTLSPFYMATTEITQGQWQALMGNNPSRFTGDATRPVEQVSYLDITDQTSGFLKKLNEATATTRPAGWGFRLPTEAEWEYAARGGTTTRFYWGDDPTYTIGNDYAWWYPNFPGSTPLVRGKLPNPWGLYDMSGGVWEWCQDWYGAYTTGSALDPVGPDSGVNRVVRGGSYNVVDTSMCRSAFRAWNSPNGINSSLGFRVVLVITTAPIITSHPVSASVNQGQPASFSVTASGTPPLTYQWKKGGTDISGATASTYSIASAQGSDAGSYTVVVSNLAGAATSDAATLSVDPVTLWTVTPVAGTHGAISPNTLQAVSNGASVSFTALPDAGYRVYIWTRDGALVQTGGNTYLDANVTSNHGIQVNFIEEAAGPWTVTPAAGANGAISPNTPQTVANGGSVSFTALPSAGYQVDQWTRGGTLVQTGGNTYLDSNVTSSHIIQVTFKVATAGSWTVTPTAGANGAISPNTPQTAADGGSVSFTALPSAGYQVDQWTRGGTLVQTGGNTYLDSNVTSSHIIQVTFKVATAGSWTVTPTAGANGAISPNTPQTVADGGSVSFTALPSAGYQVDQWTRGGTLVQTGGNTYLDSNVTSSHIIQVTFKVATAGSWTVTPTAGANGAISPNTPQTVADGGSVSFTALPSAGYQVDQWTRGGTLVQTGGNTYLDSNVTSSHVVQVTYKPLMWTVTGSVSGGNGQISPVGAVQVINGATQDFTATPAAGYRVKYWMENGTPKLIGNNSYTTSVITSNLDVTVSFEMLPPTITSFTPPRGLAGSTVTIFGTGFYAPLTLRFNGITASSSVVSATQITATVPSGNATGYITLTTPSGSTQSASYFFVDSLPTITDFSPKIGPIGTSVTIYATGTRSGVKSISFNGVPATSWTTTGPDQHVAVVPAGASSGPISLDNFYGVATSSASFTLTGSLSVTVLSPSGSVPTNSSWVRVNLTKGGYGVQSLDQSPGTTFNFTNLVPGTYVVEAYGFGPNPFDGYPEFWASQTVSVGTSPATASLQRNFPYVWDLRLIKVATGAIVNPGETLPAGTQIRMEAVVKNWSGGTRQVRVAFLLDQDQASPWNFADVTNYQSIANGQTLTISSTTSWTPVTTGAYYQAVSLEDQTAGKLDAWNWANAFRR